MTPLPDPDAFRVLEAAGVEGELAERLAVYAALVLDANRRLNLTGAKTGAAFAAHIVDALTLRDDVRSPLIDVGSGNGLPGIPLAVATGARVTLLEPIKKRTAFLAAALATLGIDGEAVARARRGRRSRSHAIGKRFRRRQRGRSAAAPPSRS